MLSYCTPQEALALIQSGDRIFLHGAAATPAILVNALVERHASLHDVEICHMHTEGPADYARPEYEDSFRVNNFFIGANMRPYIEKSNSQYIPIFLSEIPLLFKRGILPLNAALIQVSPPDRHGFCSLGVSVDAARCAVESARTVIAQVNPRMPRSHGDGLIHTSRISAATYQDTPIYEHILGEPTAQESAIGRFIAGIIEDGACLQMGIGGIPNSVLRFLENHRHLGVHTEMFSDGMIPLVEKGVIDGSRKNTHPGKIVGSFAFGSRKVYDFIDDNPLVQMLDVAYVNDTSVIRRNPRATAINSAIEIDLTGQVCADSIGSRMFSGVGGQMDFIRGASLSEEGRPIIGLTSVTAKGESKIVPVLRQGAGVVTTRAHVHYIVTEYGVVDLYGKNLSQRAKALISIAHPDHREALEKQALALFGKYW